MGRADLLLATRSVTPRKPAEGGEEDGLYTLGRYLSRLQLLTSYRYRGHSPILYSPSFVSTILSLSLFLSVSPLHPYTLAPLPPCLSFRPPERATSNEQQREILSNFG